MLSTFSGKLAEFHPTKITSHNLIPVINNEKILQIDTPNEVKMQASEWLAIVSRFDVMLIQKSGLLVKIKNDKLIIKIKTIKKI